LDQVAALVSGGVRNPARHAAADQLKNRESARLASDLAGECVESSGPALA
jgi:hypothetical protein